ncbi:hypothetical protein DSO57_1005037, partial [Entomophthora muscae]
PIKALPPEYAGLVHNSESFTLEEVYVSVCFKYSVHMEKEHDQKAKISFICNLFVTNSIAKKEASALEALETRLKDITSQLENVLLAQEQLGPHGSCTPCFW